VILEIHPTMADVPKKDDKDKDKEDEELSEAPSPTTPYEPTETPQEPTETPAMVSTEEPVISARTIDWDAINTDAVASESYVATADYEDDGIGGLGDEDLDFDGEDLALSEHYVATALDDIEPTPVGGAGGDSFIPPRLRKEDGVKDEKKDADETGSVASDLADLDALGDDETIAHPPDMTILSNKEAFEALQRKGDSKVEEFEGNKFIVWEGKDGKKECIKSKALSGWFSKWDMGRRRSGWRMTSGPSGSSSKVSRARRACQEKPPPKRATLTLSSKTEPGSSSACGRPRRRS